jgi:hypothetical protein
MSTATAISAEQLNSYAEAVTIATSATPTIDTKSAFSGNNIEGKGDLARASKLTQSISDATAQKIKNDLLKTINDKNSSN